MTESTIVEAKKEMTHWRDSHLWFAEQLELGNQEKLLARYQDSYMTASFHRKAAADYERWLAALEEK